MCVARDPKKVKTPDNATVTHIKDWKLQPHVKILGNIIENKPNSTDIQKGVALRKADKSSKTLTITGIDQPGIDKRLTYNRITNGTNTSKRPLVRKLLG